MTLLGKSWRTGLVGVVSLLTGVLGFAADVIYKQGLPNTIPEWLVFGGLMLNGLAGLLQKDAKVTNSSNPAAAVDVTPAIEAKANPSAVQ